MKTKKGFIDGEMLVFNILILVIVVGIFIVGFFRWDYNTGRDTGYISAVDKMTFSEDKKIYLRRRPLDSAISYKDAEEDEHIYCTTADRTEVIEKAYEALESGKRVTVIYDEPRPFGFVKFGKCNQTPITDIRIIEN